MTDEIAVNWCMMTGKVWDGFHSVLSNGSERDVSSAALMASAPF